MAGEPLPARDAQESVARGAMERDDSALALAHFRVLGRLEEVEDPAHRAAELIRSDPDAVVVVQGPEQEQELRAAIHNLENREARQRLQQAAARAAEAGGSRWLAEQTALRQLRDTGAQHQRDSDHQGRQDHGGEPRPTGEGSEVGEKAVHRRPTESRIVQADSAYAARRDQRQRWLEQMTLEERPTAYKPEPNVIERAYVMTGDPLASPALTRAVSVAAESHLITRPLHPELAPHVAEQAQRLASRADAPPAGSQAPAADQQAARDVGMEARKAADQKARQAQLHRELAYEPPRPNVTNQRQARRGPHAQR